MCVKTMIGPTNIPTGVGISKISARYMKESWRLQTYEIKLPANMLGKFEVSGSSNKEMTINGEK